MSTKSSSTGYLVRIIQEEGDSDVAEPNVSRLNTAVYVHHAGMFFMSDSTMRKEKFMDQINPIARGVDLLLSTFRTVGDLFL